MANLRLRGRPSPRRLRLSGSRTIPRRGRARTETPRQLRRTAARGTSAHSAKAQAARRPAAAREQEQGSVWAARALVSSQWVKAKASSSPILSQAHSGVSGNTASTEPPRAAWVRSARRRRRNVRMSRRRSAAARRGSVPGSSYRARQRQSPRSRPRRRRCRPPHREEYPELAPEPAPARPKYDARDASRGRAIAACTLEQSWLLQFRQSSQKRVPNHIVRWYRARRPGEGVAAPLDDKRMKTKQVVKDSMKS